MSSSVVQELHSSLTQYFNSMGPWVLTRERPAQPVDGWMRFHCLEEQGAFVFMNTPMVRKQIIESYSLIRYIRHNIDHWYEWARNKYDLEIAIDDIVFISGVTKAGDWGLGSFQNSNEDSRLAEVRYSASTPFSKGTFQSGGVQVRTKPQLGPDDMPCSAPLSTATIEQESEDGLYG